MEKRKYKRKTIWTKNSEKAFIKLWKLKHKELRSVRKNSHIIKEMVELLRDSDVLVTVADIKNKISNITMKYKKERAKVGPRSNWHIYDDVHQLLGGGKNSNTERAVPDSDLTKYEKVYDDPLSTPSPAPTSAAAVISTNTNFEKQILKYMESFDKTIKDLVVEMRESNEIERKKTAQIETCVNCMVDLTTTMTDLLIKQN